MGRAPSHRCRRLTTSGPAVLFLAIGAGAVFQVAVSIGRGLVWRGEELAGQRMPLAAFSGLAAGMLVLYVVGGPREVALWERHLMSVRRA